MATRQQSKSFRRRCRTRSRRFASVRCGHSVACLRRVRWPNVWSIDWPIATNACESPPRLLFWASAEPFPRKKAPHLQTFLRDHASCLPSLTRCFHRSTRVLVMRDYLRCDGWAAWIAVVCALVAGCGDECRVGDSECISSALIQTCVPTEDGNEWLVHQCGATERCQDKAQRVSDGGTMGDAGADAGKVEPATSSGGAACTGTCETGEHACVT